MKIKSVLIFPLLFALLASCLTFPASAEERGYKLVTYDVDYPDRVRFEKVYDNAEDLWDAAIADVIGNSKNQIILYQDWDLYEEKKVEVNGPVISIDLNGHSIIRHTDNGGQVRNGGVFRVIGNARLEIRDSDPNSAGYDGIRGGVITGGSSTNGGGAFTVTDTARVTVTGGTVYKCTTNEHGGAVLLKGSSDATPCFEMNGGRIYFCQTTGASANSHGGAIYSDQGDVLLGGGVIDSCYSEDNGGAIYMNSGTLSAENVRFTGNHCLDYGGAVFISGGSLRVSRCRFSSNEAKKDGGAVYVDADDGSQFRDCIFNKNKSFGAGGAIYVNDDRTFLIDTDVIANSAAGYGGGIYVDSMDDVGVKGLVRIYNNSGKNGRDNLTLQNGFATRAYLSDGGLYEGSRIGLSSTGTNVRYADDISVYQAGYFFSDRGELTMEKTYERDASMLASVFTDGGYIWIVVGAALLLLCGAAAYAAVAKKRQKGARVK